MAKRLFLLGIVLLLGVMSLGCETLGLGKVDEEQELLDPPTVAKVFNDSEDLGLCPVDLLERRMDSATADLADLYEERKDDAPNDRAEERLDARLDRALVRLENNYDKRLGRVVARQDRAGLDWLTDDEIDACPDSFAG